MQSMSSWGRTGRSLVIRRYKAGRRYSVLPGGGIEPDERAEAKALRELLEETGARRPDQSSSGLSSMQIELLTTTS